MANCSENVAVCSNKCLKFGYLYIITLICIFGTVFNCLNLLVFSKSQFRSKMTQSTLVYLTGLALADLIACISSIPLPFIRCVDAPNEGIKYFYNFYEKYIYHPVGNTFITISVWITLIFTIDRYVFVTKNNGEVTGQSSIRPTVGAIGICSCIVFIGICIFIPTLFFYEDVSGDGELIESEFGKSLGYEIYSWIRMHLTKIIPILVVTALNIALIRVTYQNSKKLKGLVYPTAIYTKRVKAQQKMTVMLLSISFTFVFCHSMKPFLNSRVHETLFGPCSLKTTAFGQFSMVVLSLEMVSCASNFVSFCLFNSHFLTTLKNCCKNNSVNPTAVSSKQENSKNGTKVSNGKLVLLFIIPYCWLLLIIFSILNSRIIGGSRGTFHFRTHFHRKVPWSNVGAPTPNEKSWIHNCVL